MLLAVLCAPSVSLCLCGSIRSFQGVSVAELGKSYFVVDERGRLYGPADMATLAGWAHTRRLRPDSVLQDPETGQTFRADSIPELHLALTSPPPGHGSGCFSVFAVVLAA